MAKRNIGFFVHAVGSPTNLLFKHWSNTTSLDPSHQSLIYLNSAKACNGTLMIKLEAERDSLPLSAIHTPEGKLKLFIALTGECGIMMKAYLMAAFCGDGDIDESFDLPFLWTMPVTSAAQCGLSSKKCRHCYRYGPCPTWHDLMQEMGRVARNILEEAGTNDYNIYLNVNTFLTLWIRAQRQPTDAVRSRHVDQLMSVTKALLLPSQCYHVSLEQHFKNPNTFTDRGPCQTQCSYCTNDFANFTGAVSKKHLIAALQANIFHRGSVRAELSPFPPWQ